LSEVQGVVVPVLLAHRSRFVDKFVQYLTMCVVSLSLSASRAFSPPALLRRATVCPFQFEEQGYRELQATSGSALIGQLCYSEINKQCCGDTVCAKPGDRRDDLFCCYNNGKQGCTKDSQCCDFGAKCLESGPGSNAPKVCCIPAAGNVQCESGRREIVSALLFAY
jgi:hypothetical protein